MGILSLFSLDLSSFVVQTIDFLSVPGTAAGLVYPAWGRALHRRGDGRSPTPARSANIRNRILMYRFLSFFK